MSIAQQFQSVTSPASEDRRERTPPKGIKWHPYADLFPWIQGQAREELKADIAKNGVLEPIVFMGEYILDGRNRYDIARELGIEYPRVEFIGDDPLAFVLAKNLTRRHLTESQRAMVAGKLAKLPAHRPAEEDNSANLRTSDAAAMLNVSTRSVETARKVLSDAAPELVQAVEAGEVSVSAAAEVASLPKEDQVAAVAGGDRAVKERAKAVKAEKAAQRKTEQAKNDRQRDQTRAALPEWHKSRESAKEAAIANRQAANELTAEDRLAEQAEAIASLEAENEDLRSRVALFSGMETQWQQGGFEKVIAGKDEEIRVLQTRLYRESEDKASWARSAKFWKEQAIKAGFSSDEIIPLNDPAETADA